MIRSIIPFLLLLLPCLALGQAPPTKSAIPSLAGINLPVSETYIKVQFTERNNLRMVTADQTKFEHKATWNRIEPGCYYSNLELQEERYPEISGLKVVRLRLRGTEQLNCEDGKGAILTRSHIAFSDSEEVFLVGVDPGGKLHYLSGGIFLDPLDGWVPDVTDMATVAKIRLAYLSPRELKPIKSKPGHWRYDARSDQLKRNIVIDLQDQSRFMIAFKAKPTVPIYTSGDWKME